MESEKTASAPSPFDDEPAICASEPAKKTPKPRLSILHLLVWTATSAAMLAVYRPFGGVDAKLTTWEIAYEIGCCIYGGIVAGGVFMWAARAWRRERFPVEPGEWLFVVQGGTVVLLATMSLLGIPFREIGGELRLLALGFVAMGMLPVFLCRQGRAWRLFFSVFALLYCTPLILLYPTAGKLFLAPVLILRTFAALAFWLMVLALLFLIGAVATDYGKGTRRGWVHWLGVGTAFVFALCHVAIVIVAAAI